jgi:hypothetical protein
MLPQYATDHHVTHNMRLALLKSLIFRDDAHSCKGPSDRLLGACAEAAEHCMHAEIRGGGLYVGCIACMQGVGSYAWNGDVFFP